MTQIFQPHASLRGHYAGFVTRSIAFVIDLVLVVLTQVTFLLIVRLVLDFFGLNALAQAIFEPTEATDSSRPQRSSTMSRELSVASVGSKIA